MKDIKHSGYYYGALLYVYLIPFHQQWATIGLGVWLLLSLISFQNNVVKNTSLLLLPAMYALYTMGFFTSDELYFKFLETKLSLLVFPLLFFLHHYTQEQRNKILKTFVLGLVAASLACLIYGIFRSIHVVEGTMEFAANVEAGRGFMESVLYGGNYFFGRNLSIFHQTVYFALYLCAGISVVLFYPKFFSKWWRLSILVFLVFMLFLISNKASFIALAGIFLVYVLTLKTQKSKKLIGLTLMVGIVTLFVFTNPRARESIKKVTQGELKLDKNARYGFGTRILSWDAAVTLIKANPVLGYGAGDTQSQLNKVYEQKEYKHPLRENFNSHNLWLQTWLENGIIAIFILIGIFFILFESSCKTPINKGFYLTLVLILLINTLFESMFNRFSGVSFFSFVVCFIFSRVKSNVISE